jgi:hypothetical protein
MVIFKLTDELSINANQLAKLTGVKYNSLIYRCRTIACDDEIDLMLDIAEVPNLIKQSPDKIELKNELKGLRAKYAEIQQKIDAVKNMLTAQ